MIFSGLNIDKKNYKLKCNIYTLTGVNVYAIKRAKDEGCLCLKLHISILIYEELNV
jgi:hypothetical protein